MTENSIADILAEMKELAKNSPFKATTRLVLRKKDVDLVVYPSPQREKEEVHYIVVKNRKEHAVQGES